MCHPSAGSWYAFCPSSPACTLCSPYPDTTPTVKVRLQTRTGNMPKSMSGTFVHIIKHEGPRGLYNGLSASLLRQLTYSTTRFGIYEELKSRYAPRNSNGTQKPPSFALLIAMSCAAGFVGGFVGNAADVLNVRMQHDASLPHAKRRNYAHALDGLVRMARDEGVKSWFRGVVPNSMRAAAMTASQLASYDVFKRTILRLTPMEDGIGTHFTASFLAGVVAATVTSPIDVIKTRVMSAAGHCSLPKLLGEIYAAEGLRWMFKGWVPSFLRLGPYVLPLLLFFSPAKKLTLKQANYMHLHLSRKPPQGIQEHQGVRGLDIPSKFVT